MVNQGFVHCCFSAEKYLSDNILDKQTYITSLAAWALPVRIRTPQNFFL